MTAKVKISPELLSKIKAAVNIVEIVGEHVVLRQSGSNYTGLCPFHSERSPSFSVSELKQFFYCYGCQKGGDAISFVTEIFGISFPDAVVELADRGRVALPTAFADTEEDPETRKRREAAREKLATAYRLNRFVAAFYHQLLEASPTARRYFEARGVETKGELFQNFYLGYANPAWDMLSEHLTAKQAPLAIAQELGLIRPSTKPGKSGFFDLFRNRAIFPILDTRGKVAGFGGRSLPMPEGESADAETGPKYLNSSDSPIFQKSRLAYGLYQAQKHVREKDEIILVEGYFDVLALHAAGFRNVVATCGTSLTSDHLQLFQKFASRITVLFDGDKAGVAATERAMELGLSHGLALFGAAMPEGLDPDEVLFDQETGKALPDGVARITDILGQAHPLIDTQINEQIRLAGQGPEARTQALKQIGKWLAGFKDPVGREVRVQAVQRRLDVPRALLEKAAGGEKSLPRVDLRAPAKPVARRPDPAAAGRLSHAEREILMGMVGQGPAFLEIFQEIRGSLPPKTAFADLFERPSAREWIGKWEADLPSWEALLATPAKFMDLELDSEIRSAFTEALVKPAEAVLSRADLKNALDRRTAKVWARFSQQIKFALADAEAKKDAELQSRLMKEYLDVQRKMKEFNCFYDEA